MSAYNSLNRTKVRIRPQLMYIYEVAAALNVSYWQAMQDAKASGQIQKHNGLFCIPTEYVEAQTGPLTEADFGTIAKGAKEICDRYGQHKKAYEADIAAGRRTIKRVRRPRVDLATILPSFGRSPAADVLPDMRKINDAKASALQPKKIIRVIRVKEKSLVAWVVAAAAAAAALVESFLIVGKHL